MPRGLGLRAPGLPGDRRGRRPAGPRLRRPVVPGSLRLADDATVIQLSGDPFYSRYPMRTYPCDIPLAADPMVPAAARGRGPWSGRPDAVAARRARLAEAHRVAPRLGPRGGGGRREEPIGFQWVSRCIGELLGPTHRRQRVSAGPAPRRRRRCPGGFSGLPTRAGWAGAWARRSARSSGRPTRPSSRRSATARISSAPRRPPTLARSSTLSFLIVIFNNPAGTPSSAPRARFTPTAGRRRPRRSRCPGSRPPPLRAHRPRLRRPRRAHRASGGPAGRPPPRPPRRPRGRPTGGAERDLPASVRFPQGIAIAETPPAGSPPAPALDPIQRSRSEPPLNLPGGAQMAVPVKGETLEASPRRHRGRRAPRSRRSRTPARSSWRASTTAGRSGSTASG